MIDLNHSRNLDPRAGHVRFLLPVLVAVVWVLVACPSQAQFNYTTNNGTVTITGYITSTNGVVVIPTTIDGLPVTSIGTNAFQYATPINTISIRSSVTNIGDSAFYDCIRLTSVTIPNSVTTIGANAFGGDNYLTSVTIPDSVTTIGGNAFKNSGLTSVTIPNSVTKIGDGAFEQQG